MQYTFPAIKTTRSRDEQAEKIGDEVKEYLEDYSDEEAVDVLHATETFIRVHFKGREDILENLIKAVIAKNESRGYYDCECH